MDTYEVYCGTCKENLCNATLVDQRTKIPKIFVNVCENCLDDLRIDKDQEIDLLKSEIKKLEKQIEMLEK